MKLFVGFYLLVGLLLAPFVYSNDGQEYKPGSTAYKVGQSIGASVVFWPSYVFAWEPEVNGDSELDFLSSLNKMIAWREDKLFTAGNARVNYLLLLDAIGLCMVEEGFDGSVEKAFSKLFGKESDGDIFSDVAKSKIRIMKRFDGMDFKDVLDEGHDCGKKLR